MDPRKRLQVLNQSNPSLRVATAPQLNVTVAQPQQKLYVGNTEVTPDANASTYSPPSHYSTPKAVTAATELLKETGGFIPRFALNYSQAFGNLGRKAAGAKQQSTEEFYKGTPGVDKLASGVDANGKLSQLGADAAQIALAAGSGGAAKAGEAAVAKASNGVLSKILTKVLGGAAAGVPLGAGQQLAASEATGDLNAKNAAKTAGVGAAAGGLFGGTAELLGPVFNRVFSKSARLAGKIAKESNPDKIAQMGVDPELAQYLAGETNKNTIKAVLQESKNAVPPLPPEDIAAIQEAGGSLPAYERGYGNKPKPNPAKDAYKAEQSATRGAGSTEKQTFDAGLDPNNPTDNVPAYLRKGEKLPSDVTSGNRLEDLKKQLDVMPSEENTRSVIFNLKKQLAEAIKKNPAAEQDLRNHFNEQIASLDTTVAERAKLRAEADQLTKNQERDTKLVENAATPTETQAAAVEQKVAQTVESAPSQSGAEAPANPQPDNKPGDTATNADNAVTDVESARQKVLDSLDTARASYKSADKVRSIEKGKRINAGKGAYESAGGGSEGVKAKLSQLKGKYSESKFEAITADPDVKKALLDNIENSGMREFEKLNTQVALSKIFGDVAGKPTPYDINLLRKHFGNDFADSVALHVESQGTTLSEKAAMVASTPKAAMATADLSAPLRQGSVLGSRFPKQWAVAAKESAKFFGSPKRFEAAMKEISDRPTYELMKKAKLAVDGADGITGTEEQFMSSLLESKAANKIGVGQVVGASDRAYTGFLTKLRADVFDKIISDTGKAGVELDDKALQSLGEFINSASGRGNLGSLEKHAGLLSKALFSPRLWKSRLDLLNPAYYAKLDPVARKYALQASASFASTAAVVLGLASAAGATVVWDPRSADFAKIKVGNTRYDILGGLQQNIRLGAQLITGQKINSSTGEMQTLGDGITTPSRKDLLYQFFENKENPLIGYASKLLEGKDAGGNPINPATEGAKLLIPLNAQGAYDSIKDTGSVPKGIAMSLPGVGGVGVQTYGNIATKDQGTSDQGEPTFKGKKTPDMVTDSNGDVILDAKGKPTKVRFPKDATELEKQAIVDDVRTAALTARYKRGLPGEDQALMKLTDEQLKQYVDDGKIDQSRYDHIKNIQKTAESAGRENNYKVPEGANSDPAKSFYKKWNSMDAKDQKAWLTQPADDNAKSIAQQLNAQRSKGLGEYKPSNELSKAYAEYEKDINTHPEYTEVDKRNKAKAFQTNAYKLNYSVNQRDIYSEGGSEDLKTLMENGHISKTDLDSAIKLDNELFTSGLTDSLKFSKKFRSSHGYSTPAGRGSGKGKSAALATLLPTFKGGTAAPQFSSRTRASGAPRNVQFKVPGGVPTGGAPGSTVTPYEKKSVTQLRKSVAG
jgi:hypothetical protein